MRIVEWPAESEELEALATAGTPRLVLVEEGSEPPLCADCCQDWMWRTDDEGQKRLRLHHLAMRALAHGCGVPRLDPLGLLHVGLRSVHLPHKDQMLVAVLLREFNGVVSPEQLIEAAWPNGITRHNVLLQRISVLRTRLSWVGLEILGSTKRGYSLRARQGAMRSGRTGGFEAELDSTGGVDATGADQ